MTILANQLSYNFNCCKILQFKKSISWVQTQKKIRLSENLGIIYKIKTVLS
jgi:hypothetical protein